MEGLFLVIANMTVKLDDGRGENILHYYIDSLIKVVLQSLLSSSNVVTHVSRNVTDYSSTTEPGARPDFLFYLNNFLILRGEEKNSKAGLDDAKAELIQNLKTWNVHTFGNLEYIFGFACGGEFLTFCAMSPPHKLFNLSRIFNLESVVDRFEILICVINLARLFKTCISRIPKGLSMTYKTIERPNGGTIEIQDDCVFKRVPVNSAQFQEQFLYLQDLYTVMRSEKVPHVIECCNISDSRKRLGNMRYINLTLKPCGIEHVPSSLKELVSAIRCVLLALQGVHRLGYAHCDIRWPNVLFVNDGDWRLIDFENSSQGDSSLWNKDMHMVGKMLSCCETLVASSETLLSLREQLISESRPPLDASTALALLANVST